MNGRPTTRALALGLTALLTAGALTACSSTQDTPSGDMMTGSPSAGAMMETSSAQAEHNAADTEFAQAMIEHHQGAVEMADLAVQRASSPEVRDLAAAISQAQGPEIATMTGWLQTWGESTTSSMEGMDMPGMDMNGMTQDEVMEELEALSGTAFDHEFLTQMIAHHEGAIEMATTETTDGQNPEAIALAEKIVTDQTAEIEKMKTLVDASL